jgi:RNA polymerase sigma factor (sigma-70 family)
MLDPRRVAAQPDEKREQLFTERYEDLLAWALRLTNQRESAEDLVQDAFVQFMLGRTRLEEIENIDGYLRRMLRYMHIARLNRSEQLPDEEILSVADYDTWWLGWSSIELPRRVQASEELHQICTYACSRKESSKAGSVLILRFFLDYFPTEIARILNCARGSVDELQRHARREAKLFMNEPRRLRFVNAKKAAQRHHVKYLTSEGDLMLGLRRMIFDSCTGECLLQEELEEVYGNEDGRALNTPKLAHVVSCPQCLDAVNKVLGLPTLSERYRSEPGKEPPPTAGGGGVSGGGTSHGDELSKKFGRRLRETHEHKPHELRIAVNGFRVSSLKVGSALNELNLNLTPDDPIEFIEVCSEQGVQLLFFSLNPIGREPEQWAWIELSEGRLLEACFRNENGPSLHVVYKDPIIEKAFVTGETPDTNTLSSPLFVVPAVHESREPNVGAGPHRSWTRRLVDVWRRVICRPLVAEETVAQNDELPFLEMLSGNREYSRRRLALLVVLVSAALVAGLLFFKASLAPELTATVLLERASVVEQSAPQVPDKVRRRYIRLEERRSAEGAIVAQRRIEVLENRVSGSRSQRLYDDSNKLIAGAWQKPDGSRMVFHHGSKPRPEPALTSPANLLLNLEDAWQLPPSAEIFGAVIGDSAAAKVDERSTTYVLSYDKVRTIGATRLLKATLTLNKSDLNAIEQTLLLARPNETRELRFVVASDELVPKNTAAFEIDAELIGGAGQPGRPGDWALRDLISSHVPPSPSTSTPAASAELEVDVAYLLNQAKADRNEQVALTRSAGGSLRVEGVVDTQERKGEFLRAMAPVSNNPAVKIEIRTVAEATQRSRSAGAVSVHEVEKTADTLAADNELRAYFSKTNSGGATEEEIRSYSSRVVNRAYRALFHAIELRKLIDRFANVDMRTVAPDARTKWLKMLQQHASSFARENALLRQEIGPVFFPGSSSHVGEVVSIQNDAELARAVERLHKFALSNNVAIRSALTISAQSSATAIKSLAFWQSLERAESFAKGILQYASN